MTEVSTAPPAAASAESPTPALPRYITLREAAEALDSKPWPIHERICSGELSAIEYNGAWLVSAQDVERLDGVVPQGRAVQRAGVEVLRALALPLRVINEARGTNHTLASVAVACGADVEVDEDVDDLTLADTDAMATYIGGTLLAEAAACPPQATTEPPPAQVSPGVPCGLQQ